MLIEFARGDFKSLSISITGFAGKIEQIYFTVKENANSDKILLQKSIGKGIEYSEEIQKYVLKFEPQDTDSLEMNKVYGFDFELYAEKGNLKRTFVGQLHLTNEYTHTKDEV